MKNLFLFFLLLLSLNSPAQKIGGFYKGTLFNDSTKMKQNYELALAEYRGKIMGYSYVTFIANDTFYYGIRKIKAKIVDGNLIVEDGKMIANNFPESPAKHVNRIITIPLKGQEDSLITINGRWKTNQTKIYYSVSGSVKASKSNDSPGSALFIHLKELNLMPNENYTVVETKKKEKENREKYKTEEKILAPKKEGVILNYLQRENHVLQTIDVASDSLLLSFYDNGVVDGDSISVYLNGVPVVQNSMLKSVATKKIISIAGNSEAKLLLVAENLGSIPPNTGLLIIKDGEKTYQINFSADLQTNASIIIRKR